MSETAGPVVVDTNVFSYLFRRDALGEAYRRLLAGRPAFMSFQAVSELDRWTLERGWGERRKAELEARLSHFTVVPWDRGLGRRWAAVVSRGKRSGRPVGVADAWIAATALELGLPLATHNAAHFAHVEGLALLTAGEDGS